VDWSCRWLVQGFYRHVRGEHGHKPVPRWHGKQMVCETCWQKEAELVPVSWVRPHLRGPEGKPLKASQTLYKLAR
jgi:hypothetical protein